MGQKEIENICYSHLYTKDVNFGEQYGCTRQSQAFEVYWLQEDRVTARLEQSKLLQACIWRHILRAKDVPS